MGKVIYMPEEAASTTEKNLGVIITFLIFANQFVLLFQ